MAQRDWFEWHRKYEDADDWHAHRLLIVQRRIREVLDGSTGALQVVSICAGQGRDLIGVGETPIARVHYSRICDSAKPAFN